MESAFFTIEVTILAPAAELRGGGISETWLRRAALFRRDLLVLPTRKNNRLRCRSVSVLHAFGDQSLCHDFPLQSVHWNHYELISLCHGLGILATSFLLLRLQFHSALSRVSDIQQPAGDPHPVCLPLFSGYRTHESQTASMCRAMVGTWLLQQHVHACVVSLPPQAQRAAFSLGI